MAIAVRPSGNVSYNVSSASSQTVSLPAGSQVGDLLVASVTNNNGSSFNVPAGWTLIGQEAFSVHPPIQSSAIYRVVQSGDTSWSFTWGLSATAGIQILTFSGVDQSSPIDSTATVAASFNASTVSVPADTISTSGAWYVIVLGSVNTVGGGEFSASGFTDIDSGSASPCSGLIYSGPLSSGSTGGVTVTAGGSATSQAINAIPFALTPAATGETLTASPGSFILTGESSGLTHQRVVSANPGAIVETGEAASLRRGHVELASPGSFVLTGEPLPFVPGGILVASPGVFVETGKAATFLRAHVLHANPGTFIETGKAATLGADNTLAASPGGFHLIPTTAGLTAQHEIFAADGPFSLTGKGALLYPGVTLFANPGVFTEGRIPAGLTASRELFAAPGVFVETGQAIVMDAGMELIAAPGVFHVSGGLVALQAGHTLTAVEPATFEVTGKSANLVVSTPVGPPGPTAYHVYSNTGVGDPINYDSPVATVTGLTWSTQPLASPATWKFGVRAFDPLDGLEEQNLDCSVTVVLCDGGLDVSNAPLPPIAISAQPNEGASIRVVWSYPSLNAASAPTGFHVYVGTGGVPNYSIPAATVIAGTGLLTRYQAVVTGLQNGMVYTVGVRAFNAVAEEQNTYTVEVTAVSVGPRAVVGLTAVATSQG